MACTLCLGLTLLLFPPALRHEPLDQIALRFGYPGPTHYEREIRVRLTGETEISPAANRLLGNVRRVPDGVTGEGGRPSRAGVTRGPKGPGPSGLGGGGNDDVTSLAHLRGSLPTVQSDELVIVTLVKPDYPRVAIEQGVEGRVELLALVDTVGAVRDVEVIQSAGRVLDGAASMAVRRCRFQPYVRNGRVQPVYANFRFNFTLLER
jgi:protein TonB